MCLRRKNSIILNAFKYIEEPKPRVDELNTDLVAELEARQGEKLEEACSDSDSAPALPTLSTIANLSVSSLAIQAFDPKIKLLSTR